MSCRSKMRGARKTGWLSKRGGRIHTWHKRWFVLTGDLLFYYKTPQDSRPTGTIPLASNKVIRHPDDPKQPSSFKFEIVSGSAGQAITGNHETYLISADSAELADSWVAAIRRVLHEPYGGGMFGRSLEETLQVEARLGGGFVPVLIHRCVKYIREHGLKEVGIFRLPGQASRIQTLKELYDAGSQEDFLQNEDIHTVASLLKLYLKELPEPVVPFVLYSSYTEAVKLFERSPGEGMEQIKRLLLQLPKVNFDVLKYICRFLHEVSEYSEENKMNSVNLGTIFGPHLLRPNTEDPHVLMECNNVSMDFVRFLLARLSEFFPLTVDERPPKRLSVVIPPGEVAPWIDAPKSMKVQQRSLYNTKSRGTTFRPRQNSAPPDHHKSKSGGKNKVMSMVEQFNLRSSKNSDSQLQYSFRDVKITAPIITPPQEGLSNGHVPSPPPPPDGIWKMSPLFKSSDSDEEVPEMIKRLSAAGIPGQPSSDTLSSDIIVNSISTELEGLEQQLAVAREEVQRYKKAARLWKNRYDQEHRARVAGEQQIRELQRLIDETFQQFALDDSEDDFDLEDGDSSVYGGTDSASNLLSGSAEPVVLPTILTESDGITDSEDVVPPLTYSGSLLASHGSGSGGGKLRPTRHSLA